MSKKKGKVASAPGLVPAAQLNWLVLQHAHFDLLGDWPGTKKGLEVTTNFHLSAVRLGAGELGVEFRLEMRQEGVFETTVAYRMGFAVETPEGEVETEVFQRVAARIAPIVAFPYIREMVTSLAAKSGAPAPIILPVLNVGGIFAPDGIQIVDSPAEPVGHVPDMNSIAP